MSQILFNSSIQFFLEQKEEDRNRTVFIYPNNSFTNIILIRNPRTLESESLDFNYISIT